MTNPTGPTTPTTPTEPEGVRATVIARYSGYARVAMAGGIPVDSEPDADNGGCFGPSAYDGQDSSDAPDGALRASLGCGNPLAVADLQPGEVVLDLGSGGGLDVLLSARRVGPAGRVYGLDASPDMIRLAAKNAEQSSAGNVEFLNATMEDIPLPDNHVDVIISNCVINLAVDKSRVLAEAFRVLRCGGRLGISDVIVAPEVDAAQRIAAERRVGCAAGTITAPAYHDILAAAGFIDTRVSMTSDAGGGLHSAIIQATKPSLEAN